MGRGSPEEGFGDADEMQQIQAMANVVGSGEGTEKGKAWDPMGVVEQDI